MNFLYLIEKTYPYFFINILLFMNSWVFIKILYLLNNMVKLSCVTV